ncbi:hypothetical protein BVC93_24785 [Mycobacterium sp. MS1601]|uniref:phosphotransferase enzyme family protein n=1 Tax=Mycobacterium sp. MS1601 TaxID=1936029 RepID=UPI0009794259|nr:phosphotransferase [Mycobacterium sp. MS1601]AQA05085.1 hypothetical protein BVC93_24785 [Mycobacterium sp. MS1601]
MPALSNDEMFARLALERYELPPAAKPRLISTSENSTFLVEDGGPLGVLRVYRKDNQSTDAVRSELAWIESLREDGVIKTPGIRRTLDGELFVWVQSGDEVRACALFEHVPGSEPQSDDLATFSLVGRTAALLHHHVENWSRPSWFTRPRWDLDGVLGADAVWGQWIDGPGVTDERAELLRRAEAEVRRNLQDYRADDARGGLVHCDLRAANLLKSADGDVWVIDFDDSGFSWYLWDLCSSTTLIEHQPDVDKVVTAWLAGYTEVRQLSAEDFQAIPHLVFLRRLHLLAWLGTHPEADLAHELGDDYAAGTCEVAERYLAGTFLPGINN